MAAHPLPVAVAWIASASQRTTIDGQRIQLNQEALTPFVEAALPDPYLEAWRQRPPSSRVSALALIEVQACVRPLLRLTRPEREQLSFWSD
eukprot:1807402-Alexandrium_andersonii.AAC.1